MSIKALIVGGDARQKTLVNTLKDSCIDTFYINSQSDADEVENIEKYTHIILPLPLSKDGKYIFSDNKDFKMEKDKLLTKLSSSHCVIGGMIDNGVKNQLNERNIEFYDYFKDAAYVTRNAFLTAQGAVRLLLENTGEYVVEKKALVIGFGKVAKALCIELKALGLDIYVAARNHEQLEYASCLGYKTIRLQNLRNCIYFFDFIFGTVPARILTCNDVRHIKDNCIYFELASKPFTANKADFENEKKSYVSGASLPGRYLPIASGKLTAEYILSYIFKQKEG